MKLGGTENLTQVAEMGVGRGAGRAGRAGTSVLREPS